MQQSRHLPSMPPPKDRQNILWSGVCIQSRSAQHEQTRSPPLRFHVAVADGKEGRACAHGLMRKHTEHVERICAHRASEHNAKRQQLKFLIGTVDGKEAHARVHAHISEHAARTGTCMRHRTHVLGKHKAHTWHTGRRGGNLNMSVGFGNRAAPRG